MSITPYGGMIDSALAFKNSTSLWIGIGQAAAWPDEANPPVEDPAKLVIDNLIALAKVQYASLVVPDNAGTVITPSQNFRLVADADGIAENARYAYFKASFDYAQIANTAYRITGAYDGLVPLPAYVAATILLPAHVQSTGRLVFLENHVVRNHDILQRNIIEVVREFKS